MEFGQQLVAQLQNLGILLQNAPCILNSQMKTPSYQEKCSLNPYLFTSN